MGGIFGLVRLRGACGALPMERALHQSRERSHALGGILGLFGCVVRAATASAGQGRGRQWRVRNWQALRAPLPLLLMIGRVLTRRRRGLRADA